MSAAAAPAPLAADRAWILAAPTPPAWVEDALSHLPELLLDHANCWNAYAHWVTDLK
jgi:tRNA isopentenyl-2-thiomethyl-A-37 hydroxylase MiaE